MPMLSATNVNGEKILSNEPGSNDTICLYISQSMEPHLA